MEQISALAISSSLMGVSTVTSTNRPMLMPSEAMVVAVQTWSRMLNQSSSRLRSAGSTSVIIGSMASRYQVRKPPSSPAARP